MKSRIFEALFNYIYICYFSMDSLQQYNIYIDIRLINLTYLPPIDTQVIFMADPSLYGPRM